MQETPANLFARAAAHYRAGENDAAAECAAEIVAQAPEHFDALHLLGVLCLNRRLTADAVGYLERAARLNPSHRKLDVNRTNAWLALEQFSRAETIARQILASYADDIDALNNLGIAVGKQGRTAEAIETHRTALMHAPNHAPSYFNIAKAFETLGRWEDAETAYYAALHRAGPATPGGRIENILRGLGRVLVERGRPEEALTLFRQERAHRTEPLELTWLESLLHLQIGNYEAGWRDYEHRWGIADHDTLREDASIPDVSNLAGKRILLVREQGRGDIIQFARYAPLLAQRGATVYMSVYDDLKSLLSMMPGVTGVFGEDELEPPHDIITPLLSLPLAFGTTITTIPARIPYLRADPVRVAYWQSYFGNGPTRHIGLAWSSTNPGAARSTALAELSPLLDCPRVTFHALQKEIAPSDLEFLLLDGRIHDHRAHLTDFAETSAMIEALDLVVTIDTAVAHLAGALGKPVWIMLPHIAEWRWLQNRTDCPWYPSARLYRQPSPGDWGGLAGQIAAALGN